MFACVSQTFRIIKEWKQYQRKDCQKPKIIQFQKYLHSKEKLLKTALSPDICYDITASISNVEQVLKQLPEVS